MKTNEIGSTTYEIKYTGYLTDSNNVVLHYGYENWNDVTEIKMKKLKSGYKAEIALTPNTELNFCFRDDTGRWDNNLEQDYYFKQGDADKSYGYVDIAWKNAKGTKTATTTKTTKTTTSKVKAAVPTVKTKTSTTKTTTRTKASTSKTKK